MKRVLWLLKAYLFIITVTKAVVIGIAYFIGAVLVVIAAPFIFIYYLVSWFIDIRRIGWKLAWNKWWNQKKYERWEGLKKAKERRIDKELHGWPEDPVERAKCPHLNGLHENDFEFLTNDKQGRKELIYVANEEDAALDDLFICEVAFLSDAGTL